MHKKPYIIWLAFLAMTLSGQAEAEPADFRHWLNGVYKEAEEAGISRSALEALRSTIFLPKAITLDRQQPESRRSFQEYLDMVLPKSRIEKARILYGQHRPLLQRISREYGVPPQYIVALWGMESDFGERPGNFSTLSALATLAYDGRRQELFRKELLTLLRLIDKERLDPAELIGSWAGAMGQCQFMPSSYRRYAMDHDGDGKRDIWHSEADVFASVANYLSTVGWEDAVPWGMRVKLPEHFDASAVTIQTDLPLEQWLAKGIVAVDEKPFPSSMPMALSIPDNTSGFAFLVSSNYKTLLDWNRSRYFASAVGMLADAIILPAQ